MSLTPFDIVQGYINTTHKSGVLGITNSVPLTNFSPVMPELEKVLNEASKIDSDFEQYIQVGLELQRADMLMQEGILRGIDEFCVGFIKGFSDAVNNQIHTGVPGSATSAAAGSGAGTSLFDAEFGGAVGGNGAGGGGSGGASNIVTVTTNNTNNTITVTTSTGTSGSNNGDDLHQNNGKNRSSSSGSGGGLPPGAGNGGGGNTPSNVSNNNSSINNLKHILPESFLSLLREQNLTEQQKRDRDLVFGLNDNRRKTSLPKKAIKHLKAWLYENRYNPYPDEKEKKTLMDDTGLSWNQISHWFINARRRYLQSMVEGSSQREWEQVKTEMQVRQAEDGELAQDIEEEDDDGDEEFDEEEALYMKTNKRARSSGKGKGGAKSRPAKKKYIRKAN